ncbi:UNVERIFIED_CONTAM: hypothetical protein HDU68_007749 [Siphonaria sp. JEL0065]|nr:hypothetical protein HDU68_007749 [Siphonaria sp. JEL0065]
MSAIFSSPAQSQQHSQQQPQELFGCMTMPDFDVVQYVPPQAEYQCALDLLVLAASAASPAPLSVEDSASGTSCTPPLTATAPSSPSPSLSSLPSPSLLMLQLGEAASSFTFPLLSQSSKNSISDVKIGAPINIRKRKAVPASSHNFSSDFRPTTPSSCSDDDDAKSLASQHSTKRSKVSAVSGSLSQFKCEHCAAVFMRNQDLTRHISSVHEKSTLFTCPGCPGTRFSRKDALKRHIRTFKCCSAESL